MKYGNLESNRIRLTDTDLHELENLCYTHKKVDDLLTLAIENTDELENLREYIKDLETEKKILYKVLEDNRADFEDLKDAVYKFKACT